jgi:dTDP-4-amino-4,6-dideoxygalactose transaminase
MRPILEIADAAGIVVIEDAAQALDSTYDGRPAGSFGRFSTFSFHETKNISCGEGGMIVLRDAHDFHRAEILCEKGTDRSAFIRGEVDRYGWVDIGSSFIPGELSAAFLYAQLEQIDAIQRRRLEIYALYDSLLREPLARLGIPTPAVPPECVGNAHTYYIVLPDAGSRTTLVSALKADGITTASHYAALHRSRFFQDQHDGRALPNSERYSDCLLRLPLYYELSDEEVHYVCEKLIEKLDLRSSAGPVVSLAAAPT